MRTGPAESAAVYSRLAHTGQKCRLTARAALACVHGRLARDAQLGFQHPDEHRTSQLMSRFLSRADGPNFSLRHAGAARNSAP